LIGIIVADYTVIDRPGYSVIHRFAAREAQEIGEGRPHKSRKRDARSGGDLRDGEMPVRAARRD
jgi:hypothetical protein